MDTKITRSVWHVLTSLGIIAIFGYYLYLNADKYLELFKFSKSGILGLILLSLAFPLLNGMQNTYLCRSLGIADFSHWDGFLITASSTLANQLPIPGGIVSKGYYLKRRYALPYTKFASSTIATFFCFFAVNGLVGVSVLLYWNIVKRIAIPSVLLVAFAGMVASLLVFWLPVNRIRMPERFRRLTQQAVDGWIALGRNFGLLSRLIVLQVALVVLLSFRYWIVFHMLSQNVTMSQTLLFASASILTQLVSIAPGGLGVRETIVASIATVLGFDTTTSVIAVGLDRLVITVMIVLYGWVSTMILGKQISVTPNESV